MKLRNIFVVLLVASIAHAQPPSGQVGVPADRVWIDTLDESLEDAVLNNDLGIGNVIGPTGDCSDNALPRFDGVSGETLQCSNVVVDDAGATAFPGDATFNGVLTAKKVTVIPDDPLDAGTELPDTVSTPNPADAGRIKLRNWAGIFYQQIGSTLRSVLSLSSADTHIADSAIVSTGGSNGAITTPLKIDPSNGNVSGQGNFPTLSLVANAGAPTFAGILPAAWDVGTNRLSLPTHGLVGTVGPFLQAVAGPTDATGQGPQISGATFANRDLWLKVFDADFVEILYTQTGSAQDITYGGGSASTSTLTPVTQSIDNQLCVYEGTDGKTLGHRPLGPTYSDTGGFTVPNATATAIAFRATGTSPDPVVNVRDRGFLMGNIPTTAGDPVLPGAGNLVFRNKNMYPTVYGDTEATTSPGNETTNTNAAHRLLFSYNAIERMTAEMVLVSDDEDTERQHTGTQACTVLSGRNCGMVEVLSSGEPTPDDPVVSTWAACSTELPSGTWFRPYCSTIQSPY